MSTQYRIGEFAALGGVSRKTLRFYDQMGLLRPACVDSRTRYRLYLPEQLEDLASILALKDLGVSLAEVHSLINGKGSPMDRKATLSELKQRIEHSIQTARQSLKQINAALEELDARQPPISVVVKRRPAVAIASLRVKLNRYEEVSQFEQELLNALPPQCLGSLRGVLWHRCADSGSLEAEPFVALQERAPARSSYTLKHLPEATLACAYSGLDDESAERAYAAIRRWIDVRGYRVAGPKREVYLGQMLEIQYPLTEN